MPSKTAVVPIGKIEKRILLIRGEKVIVDNPIHFPDPINIEQVEEPFIRASFILPQEYLGNVINLCMLFELGKGVAPSPADQAAIATFLTEIVRDSKRVGIPVKKIRALQE